ncbi:conserved hypothetical protein [Methylobacterium sp. 4-46]|uniref:hypothetical protein n=1 Tax=unclassified Methylobacterium TaxID=2615210 RepID=UPI000152E87A|nr:MULTISPECIES: hypothetical protein [Methylobacterium]ACA17791.1 conserved hypothetical protein [Methylobacterium sp. 4-46]WFT83459.1 hypothetical protein QA634_17220 [Methylobacterium nodulans]
MRPWITALAVALAAPAAAAPLDGGTRFSAVRVDVETLRARGLGGFADAVARDLQGALARSLADRLGGPGPVLVVRVSGVSLTAFAGGGGRRAGRATDTDYLDGEALVVGRGGEVLARHPQLSAVPASSGGAWYDPDSERRRVTALAEHYAWWLRRGLGLE